MGNSNDSREDFLKTVEISGKTGRKSQKKENPPALGKERSGFSGN